MCKPKVNCTEKGEGSWFANWVLSWIATSPEVLHLEMMEIFSPTWNIFAHFVTAAPRGPLRTWRRKAAFVLKNGWDLTGAQLGACSFLLECKCVKLTCQGWSVHESKGLGIFLLITSYAGLRYLLKDEEIWGVLPLGRSNLRLLLSDVESLLKTDWSLKSYSWGR